MPFEKGNTAQSSRKNGKPKQGARKRSSLENKPWTSPQLAVKKRFLGLEEANCWFPCTLARPWFEVHPNVPALHMVMDADLSLFETIVLERPGQLLASRGASWKDVCRSIGFSWASTWQRHVVAQHNGINGQHLTWINCHPNPTGCPLDVLDTPQPGLHCMLWRRKLGRIGCLEDSSAGEDAEEDAAGHGGGSKEQQTYAAAEMVNTTAGELVVELAESVEGILERLRDAASSARAAHNHDDGIVYEAVWEKLSVFAGYLAAVKQGIGVNTGPDEQRGARNARGLDTTRLRGPGGGAATIRALRAFGGARDMRGRRSGRFD